MFKLLKWNTGNVGTSKENNSPSDFFTNRLPRNFSWSRKIQKNSQENIHGDVFLVNFSYKKSITDGCFWDYLGKPSWWFSVLVARNCYDSCFEKHPWWCTFLILANKALYDDSFLVIFQIFQNSNFKQHLRTAASERFFVPRKQSPENVKRAALKNL